MDRLQPTKKEGYNKRISSVVIFDNASETSEKQKNEVLIHLRKRFTKDGIKNTSIITGGESLFSPSEIEAKINQIKPGFYLEIDDVAQKGTTYGRIIKYEVVLTDLKSKDQVWKLYLWSRSPESFAQAIYYNLVKSKLI